MKLSMFFEKRNYLIGFITFIFGIIGVLLIYVTPFIMYNQSTDKMEVELLDFADNYQTIEELPEGYNLYVHINGESTLLTRSGYIENINAELDFHLKMWARTQSETEKFYTDDFKGADYHYFIRRVADEHYVVSFVGTAEINDFISQFRLYTIILTVILYIISLVLGITFLSGRMIRQISFVNQKSNFRNRLSLEEFYKKNEISNFNYASIHIHNFQDIVDACGISFTDMISSIIGERLRSLFKQHEIYEINASEFVIVCEDEIIPDNVINIFKQKMSGNAQIETYELQVKIVTIENELLDNETIESLLKRFDYGYLLIKSKQNVTVSITHQIILEMNNEIYYQANLEQALRFEKLVNFYQPKVNPTTNKIVGCEALSRWVEGEKVISPTNYIHIAEANGLVYNIDLLSFKNSCKMLQKLSENDLLDDAFKISTNLSPITLRNLNFSTLQNIITECNVNPRNISVEITESVLIDFNQVKSLLKQIKDSGITIEIDDFSAGNSSFTVLPLLNADYLKLDMAILPTVIEESSETLVYQGLVDISKKLGFKLVSEGVETSTQADYVLDIGVDLIQGYFYSKPINSTDFINFMKAYNS